MLTLIAAGLTAFYSWRLIFMTFHGRAAGDAARPCRRARPRRAARVAMPITMLQLDVHERPW